MPRRPSTGALTIGLTALLGLGLAPAMAYAVPTITTLASPDIPLGGVLTDQATLSGGVATPTGTVTFQLWANDPTCSSPPEFISVNPLTSTGSTGGTATSAGFMPTTPGVYRWRASYSGDANNAPASGVCNDPAETRSVGQATPVLTTSASGNTQRGGQLGDSANVRGASNPTGSVTFRLYGPSDPTCSAAPVFTSTSFLNPANFDPTLVVSDTPFVPTTAGVHRWIATYNGDTQNKAVSNACGDPTQTRTVFGEVMSTMATPRITLGAGQLTDRATVANLLNATTAGTVTFRLYGPNDTTCAGTPVFVNIQPLILSSVQTIGIAQSAAFTPTRAGTYRWVAGYSGDVSNRPLTGACNDANQTSAVTPKPPPPPPKCAGKTATIFAVAGDTTITGTNRNDVIVGSAAAETIDGRGGGDLICAGKGNDTVRGGAGRDTIRGEGGRDRLSGDSGNDLLFGGTGADRLLGGSGRDRVRAAGGGADRIDCGRGPGRDDVQMDRLDRQKRCEIIRRVTA